MYICKVQLYIVQLIVIIKFMLKLDFCYGITTSDLCITVHSLQKCFQEKKKPTNQEPTI